MALADTDSRQLVQAWRVETTVTPPQVSHNYTLTLPIGKVSQKVLPQGTAEPSRAVPQFSLHFVSLCLLSSSETGLHQPMANLSHLPCAIKRPNLAQHHGASLGCRGTYHATPWWCSPRTLTHIPSVCECGPLPASCQSFHSVPYCCIAERQA